MKNNNIYSVKNIISLIFIITPILFYYYKVWKHAYNLPYSDDYMAVLGFMNQYLEAANGWEKIKLIFSQHNEHRIAFDRVIILLQYYLMGEINFTVLIWIGNLGVLFTALAFYLIFKDLNKPLIYFTPVILLLFHLQHWENMAFAMAGLQNFYIGVFILFCLYFLNKNQKNSNFILAGVFAIVATFTSSNGFFVFPVGFLLLLLNKQRLYKIISWLLLGFTFIGLYFLDFQGKSGIQQHIIDHPHEILSAFLGSIGNFANTVDHWHPNTSSFLIGIIVGYLISVIFMYLLYSRFFFQKPLIFCLIVLFMMTLGGLAIVRTVDFTPKHISAVSRYDISSVIMAICFYLALIEIPNKFQLPLDKFIKSTKKFNPIPLRYITFYALLTLCIMINFKSNQKVILNSHTRNVLKGNYYWQKDQDSQYLLTSPEYGKEVLLKSAQKGIYMPPKYDEAYFYYEKL